MKHCILCDSPDLSTISRIQVADLAVIYGKNSGIDIFDEFNGVSEVSYLRCNRCDLRFFDPPMGGSPDYYAKFSSGNSSTYYLEEKSEYAVAAKFINDTDTVLDVGAGAGNFSKYVKGSFTGLDFNPVAIKIAKERNINVSGDSIDTHLEKTTKRYSVVTCFQVLEHISNPRLFIESCLRALKPEGVFVVSVPSEDSWIPLQENAIANMPPHHVTRWTDICLRNIDSFFQIQLERLEHEELAPVHVKPFYQCMAKRFVRELFCLKNESLIDLSLKTSMVSVIANKLVPLCVRAFPLSVVKPMGHSVTVVYRKRTIDSHKGSTDSTRIHFD